MTSRMRSGSSHIRCWTSICADRLRIAEHLALSIAASRVACYERVVNERLFQFEWDEFMNNRPIDDNDMPAEIDFSKGVRGLHHIPPGAKVLMPVSIERGVWEYFAGKAERRGVDLFELVTEVLKRDIEINEALK
jgi:hypothetical protein